MRSPTVAIAALLFVLAAAYAPDAQAEIRGRSFRIGGVIGVAPFSPKFGLEPCPWFGAQVGHRFQAIAEKLHLGFRMGAEGCVGEQTLTGDRVDVILVDFAFTYGVKVTDFLQPYGISGAGFGVIDAVPSGGRTHPRTVFQGGGGIEVSLGPYFILDASVRIIVFENVQLGGFGGEAGSVVNPVITLSIGAQI